MKIRANPERFHIYFKIIEIFPDIYTTCKIASRKSQRLPSKLLRSIIDGNPVVNIIILSLDKGESSLQLRD